MKYSAVVWICSLARCAGSVVGVTTIASHSVAISVLVRDFHVVKILCCTSLLFPLCLIARPHWAGSSASQACSKKLRVEENGLLSLVLQIAGWMVDGQNATLGNLSRPVPPPQPVDQLTF